MIITDDELKEYLDFFEKIYPDFNNHVEWFQGKTGGRIYINDHTHLAIYGNWKALFSFYIQNFYTDEYMELIKSPTLLFSVMVKWSEESDIFAFYNKL